MFSEGDVVRIIDDIAVVRSLQEDHGGWVDDMAMVSHTHTCTHVSAKHTRTSRLYLLLHLFNPVHTHMHLPQSLGQAGRVTKVFPSGDVQVVVNGRVWTFNSQAMVAAPDENPPEVHVPGEPWCCNYLSQVLYNSNSSVFAALR